jgi:hypothetical protein
VRPPSSSCADRSDQACADFDKSKFGARVDIDAVGHAELTCGYEQFPRELGFLWLARGKTALQTRAKGATRP